MDFGREAVVLVLTAITMAVLGAASTVHTVGDIGGWNSDRDVDYYDWAASREFHIGDIIRKLNYQLMLIMLGSISGLF